MEKKMKELSDEMLENIVGGASIKETISYINTNMTTVPEKIRNKIIEKLMESGKPAALKLASEYLTEAYPEEFQALNSYIIN